MHRYGGVKYGNRITRDVVVPFDLPLYALHYVIQRAFGWENSHLHQFSLPQDRILAMTSDSLAHWRVMVGILFRSPLMDESDQFWADNYKTGSFKNWLRKKYTGPYLSRCRGEGLLSCQEDMQRLDMEEEYYLLYEKEKILTSVCPVKNGRPKPFRNDTSYRVETVKMKHLPACAIPKIFERDPFALLERLPIFSILAPGKDSLSEQAEICQSATEMGEELKKHMHNGIDAQSDSLERQVLPIPCTDALLYEYDFGDNWRIKITASENCSDLVESGRITQAELDRANVKYKETYRPVLLTKDGDMVMDDVGGLVGYGDFLQVINPDLNHLTKEEQMDARQQKSEMLAWARGMGWKREKYTDFSLL